MKLESISPLTTNSSSEVYLFRDTSLKDVENIITSLNDSEMELTIRSIDSKDDFLNAIANLNYYEYSEDPSYGYISLKDYTEHPNGWVQVIEHNNRLAHWQHWTEGWSEPSDNQEAIKALQEFINSYCCAQAHLG